MKNKIMVTKENLYQFLIDDDYIGLLSEYIKKQLIKDEKIVNNLKDVEIIYCTNDNETNKNIFRIKYTPYIEKERGVWMGMEDEIIKIKFNTLVDIFNKQI